MAVSTLEPAELVELTILGLQLALTNSTRFCSEAYDQDPAPCNRLGAGAGYTFQLQWPQLPLHVGCSTVAALCYTAAAAKRLSFSLF